MPITLKPYKDQIDTLSATACDSFEAAQLAGVTDIIENLPNHAVLSVADLPNAICNTGRIVYVENLCTYYYSNGISWTTCFNPPLPPSGTFALGWGPNGCGQVGDGTTTAQSSPVSVVGGFCDWLQIEQGLNTTIGLRTDGTVWTWGSNRFGALGVALPANSAYNQSSPVSVVGGFTDWCYVSINGFACSSHTDTAAAIRTNGTLWTWGFDNGGGKLGTGYTSYGCLASSPVSVVGGFTDWSKVAVGADHMLGLRSNGSIWSWGGNDAGQLGVDQGCAYTQSSPVSVVGGYTDWCAIAAGGNDYSNGVSAGVRSNGTIWTWGSNGYGVLGNNSGVGGNCVCSAYNQSSPVSVVGGFTDWCAISLGSFHALALRTNGTLWSWGRNCFAIYSLGVLGDNSSYNRSSPVSVVGGFTDWCSVGAGNGQSFAIRTNGTLWAWGFGLSGYGIYLPITGGGDSVSSPVSVLGTVTDWCSVSGNKIIFGGGVALRQLS